MTDNNLMGPPVQIDITTLRNIFTDNTSVGETFLPGFAEKFCWSLEDAVRPFGLKIKNKTAIPDGIRYRVGKRYSPSFKREMLILYTEDDKETIKITHKGKIIIWKYVYSHGGNTHKDTDACPLQAFNKINDKTIQGSAEHDLFNIVNLWLNRGYEVYWTFINNF